MAASTIPSKLNRLGRVYAGDRAMAEKLAVEEFKLNEQERKRLLIEEVR